MFLKYQIYKVDTAHVSNVRRLRSPVVNSMYQPMSLHLNLATQYSSVTYILQLSGIPFQNSKYLIGNQAQYYTPSCHQIVRWFSPSGDKTKPIQCPSHSIQEGEEGFKRCSVFIIRVTKIKSLVSHKCKHLEVYSLQHK